MYNDNLARKYEPSKRGQEISVSTVRKLRKPAKKAKVNFAKLFRVGKLITFFVLGSMLVLSRNVAVTEQSEKVAKLKKEYSRLETDNRKKEIEISQKIDIATVEERAISNSNMNRARQEQIMYVDVQAEDYGVVASQNSEKEEKNGIMWGLLAYLK